MFLCVNRVAKEGYITGNFISLPVNLQNFGIFQGCYVFNGPFVNFRLSQVSNYGSFATLVVNECRVVLV